MINEKDREEAKENIKSHYLAKGKTITDEEAEEILRKSEEELERQERDEKQRKIFESRALCPLDGRYSKIMDKVGNYFSEYALVYYRVFIEIKWLKFLLINLGNDILSEFNINKRGELDSIWKDFDEDSFLRIKDIEAKIKHDVKSVEIFIGEELERKGYGFLKSFVHIGCTSEDINNTAYAKMIQDCLNMVWEPAATIFTQDVNGCANRYCDIPMLGHTHGQPATPTTVGKEFKVYAYRLFESIEHIKSIQIKAKFNGATGNYNAISVAFPTYNWEVMSKEFVERELKLCFNPLTTQIENHDYICHLLDGIRHFNNVLLDFDRDMWTYISMDYFKQNPVYGEVGSSTMPHKVNPINFENSESNVDTSNALCMTLSNKLPISRMQRDLSDSSSLRNLGLTFGYSLQAIYEAEKGLEKIEVNKDKISSDLNKKWEVLAEPIQTMLRKYGISEAYDRLKELTRGKDITQDDILAFIETLDLTPYDKKTLRILTPETYIGRAQVLAKKDILRKN